MDQWLTIEFWRVILEKTVVWVITVVPSVFFVLLLTLGILYGVKLFISRLKAAMKHHSEQAGQQDAIEMEKRIGTLLSIISSAIKVTVWVVAGMIILRKIGIDIAPIIAGAGIVGLAVGFGAQELVRDFIAGFFMLLENQVRAGDVAIVNGTGGMVERVGLRTIVLRDQSGVVHVFQNGKVNTLANMTKEWSAIVFEIRVAYKEDIDRVIDVMKQVAAVLHQDPEFGRHILEPMEVLGVESFSDSAVVIKARIKTVPIQQWTIGRQYRRRLKMAFDEAGIEIPFPHRTLVFPAGIPSKLVTCDPVSAEQAQ